MCNNSYCSCKSSCSSCHLDNKVIYFINDVIKNWLTPAQAKENKDKLKEYYNKIDALTMMDYLIWNITEEKFLEGVEAYKDNKNKKKYQISEVVDVSNKVNPWEECVFPQGSGPWGRCIYCNSVRRYSTWKLCERRKSIVWNIETLGSTVIKN